MFKKIKKNIDKEKIKMKYEWDIIDQEEPRGQSVTMNGIPCTARHCVTHLNRLTEENEKLTEENYMLKCTIGRNESYINILTHKCTWRS